MSVEVRAEPFDPWAFLSDYQSGSRALPDGAFGASAVFVGTMRDFNEDETVREMFLEHYPGMTEKYLEDLATEAIERWSLNDVLIVHRVGALAPGDPIVLVAVWSAHRKAAFEASRYVMETLKSKAPFWKKEQLADSSRWVEKNTAG